MPGPPNVTWEDVDIHWFVDGDEVGRYAATNFNANADMIDRSGRYQGKSTPDLDSSFDGYTGSMTLELREGFDDPMEAIDLYIDGVKERESTGKTRWLVSYRRPQGDTRTMRFENLQLKPAISGGSGERVQIQVGFKAEDGVLV